MATEKVSLTLEGNVVAEARRRAGRGRLSAYVDSALRLKLRHDRLRGLLQEMDGEYGPVSEEVARMVDAEWPNDGGPTSVL